MMNDDAGDDDNGDYDDSVNDNVVSCPTRWSLYLPLALCIDHLVGDGNPL